VVKGHPLQADYPTVGV